MSNHHEDMVKLYSTIKEELRFAEAKHAALMAFGVVILVAGIEYQQALTNQTAFSFALTALMMTIGITMLLNLLAIAPLLGKVMNNFSGAFGICKAEPENYLYFGYLACGQVSVTKLLNFFSINHGDRNYHIPLAEQILSNATVVQRKHRLFVYAINVLVVGILISVLSYVICLVCSQNVPI